MQAFQIHATGYLLKPFSQEDVMRELTFIYGEQKKVHIRAQTFGGFEIFVDGQPVKFSRAKAKELLAFLIDRKGTSVTTAEAYAVLFENAEDTVSGKSYFRNIVRDLKNSLKTVHAEEILLRSFNSLAIVPDKIECDYYQFLKGDPIAVNQYRNDYMPQYSWAEFRNAQIYFHENKNFYQ